MTARTEIPAGLLADVKVYLDITWSSATTDAKVSELILSGMAYLDDKNGAPADYTVPGDARALLMDYVRYGRDNALDVFETNNAHRILAMQNGRRVAAYVESTVPTQGG